MKLFLIRHAQSENNAIWDATGTDRGRSSDPELTDLGRRQARRVADYLAHHCLSGPLGPGAQRLQASGFAITHLYTSLMLRAVATACEIGRATGLQPHAWRDLHETGGIFLEDMTTGELNGLPGNERSYFETHFPELVLPDDWRSGGWWQRPFERDDERPLRARRVLDELLRRHDATEDHVAMVCHGGFYNHLLNAIFNLPTHHGAGRWFLMHNTAITAIDFHTQERVLVYANRLEHLPADMIS